MTYRIQCPIDTELETKLRNMVRDISNLPTKMLRTPDQLTNQEKNELSFITVYRRAELDDWCREHGIGQTKRMPRSLNALIIGILSTVVDKYTPEELRDLMDNSGINPPGRPAEERPVIDASAVPEKKLKVRKIDPETGEAYWEYPAD